MEGIRFTSHFWLFANSAEELKDMTEAWCDILKKFGLNTPVSGLKWCSTFQNVRRFVLESQTVSKSLPEEGFKVFGNHCDI